MRVAHDDLRCPRVARAGDGGERLAGHEFPGALVLESGRRELVRRHDSGNTLHVDGDVNLEGSLRREGRRQRGKGENEKAKSAHAGMTVSEDPNGGQANMHVAEQPVQRVGEWGIPLAPSGYVAQFVLTARTTFTPSSHLMRLALSLIVCPLLAACLTEPKPCLNQPSDPATEMFAPSLGIDLSTMEKTAIGVYRKDIVVGTGENLSTLGVVQIHLSAFLVDGTVLDQFQDQPFPIDLA